MLRRIHSSFVWCSAFLFLVSSFFVLHSIGRCDLWSWETADEGETVSSSATLGVGKGRMALNVWIHEDDGQTRGTTLDHVVVGEGPQLRDGRVVRSLGGFFIACGARVSSAHVSYLGIIIPFWTPLVLFGVWPVYAVISAIRRRAEMRILSRLMIGASLASFALAVFLVVMWIRSFDYDYAAVPDKFFSENYAYLLSSDGITTWYFFDEPLRLRTPMWWRFGAGQGKSRLAGSMDPAARFLGFGRTKTTYMHFSIFSGGSPRPLTIVAIPYYALVAVALVLPVGMVTHQVGVMLRKRRKRKGQCPQCGYDVRATPKRCPECGFELKKSQKSEGSSPVPPG